MKKINFTKCKLCGDEVPASFPLPDGCLTGACDPRKYKYICSQCGADVNPDKAGNSCKCGNCSGTWSVYYKRVLMN